jgi:anti-sigma regulatory factor (Ser/Thr protein kinase)
MIIGETMELKVKASDENMQTVNDFIHSVIPSECDEMILNQIDLAVEEIFVNIAHYSGSAEAIIKCSLESNKLEISFSDNGIAFNPLARPDPDLSLSAEERKIGGLGIYLTKKFMDTVSYEYKDGMNCLRIIKSLQI